MTPIRSATLDSVAFRKAPRPEQPAERAVEAKGYADCLPRRRFTPAEICSFLSNVAHGAKRADVAREHGFAPSSFRRWIARYGMEHVDYAPTEEERGQASGWRSEASLSAAWRRYHAFCMDPRWSDDSELPVRDDAFPLEDDYGQRVVLRAREDAKVVLIGEKEAVLRPLDDWTEGPSVVHRAKVSFASFPPVASRWTARFLKAHAKDVGAPLVFFGDLDPQALHSFAVLRAGGQRELLSGKVRDPALTWMGLDARWLDFVCRHFRTADVPERMLMRLGWLDQEYWELVKRLVPDARKLLGARAFALLESGLKVEVDALISFMRTPFIEEFARRLQWTVRRAPSARKRTSS